jgi:hypothetical protein
MTCADDWWDAYRPDEQDAEPEPDEPYRLIHDLPDIARYQPTRREPWASPTD